MGIYRGPGGTGDAINDASSEATLVSQLVTQAQESEANASTSATAAANSASAASTSAANAATAETNAETAEANAETAEANAETAQAAAEAAQAAAEAAQLAAETAETNAETAETNAETAQSAAATSATNAASSASTATTQATNASNSASAAATSATNASNSASAAATSATNAASSATSAAGSATTATTQASNASTSASNAATSATSAAGSATTATTQAGIATTQASNAATSATNASNSASAASTSASNASTSATSAANAQSAAETARDQTLAAFDSFDDRYLGQKSTAPSVDNDGNALVAGALYFNTTTNEMKVYDGTQWLNAYASLSGALLATSNLSDLNNAATARDNLGVEIGVDVQAYDVDTAKLDVSQSWSAAQSFNAGVTLGDASGDALTINSSAVSVPNGLNFDSNTFVIDATNNRVGVGTASPSEFLTVGAGTASINSVIYINGGSDSTKGAGIKLSKAGTAFGFIGAASWMEGGTSNNLAFSATSAATVQMRLDSSGNLGLGVTPSAWGTILPLQIKAASFSGYANNAYVAANTYYNGANFIYINSDYAERYQQSSGQHQWYTAPSGTAGAAITFTQAMTLNASGQLGIGTSSPAFKLDVREGNAQIYTNSATATYLLVKNSVASSGVAFGALADGAGYIDVIQAKHLMFATNDTERMRLDSSGNLGLGVAPTSLIGAGYTQMQVSGSTSGIIDILVGSTLKMRLGADGNLPTIASRVQGEPLRFSTTPTGGSVTESMRITSAGLVGIGTGTPLDKFQVQVSGTDVEAVLLGNSQAGAVARTALRLGYQSAGYGARIVSEGNASTSTATSLIFERGAGSSTYAESMRIDAVGNLGLGVTPSAWSGTTSVLQNPSGSLYSFASGLQNGINSNAYYNGTNWIYRSTSFAGDYYIQSGAHIWRNAPSGTAGNAITFTQAMTLNASGNLGIGTTNPSGYSSGYKQLIIDSGAAGAMVQLNNTTTGSGSNTGGMALIQLGVDGYIVNPQATGTLRFYTNNTERMRIDSSGNVGIGNSATNRLSLTYDPSGGGATIGPNSTGGSTYLTLGTSNAGTYGERMRIDYLGNVGIGTSSPSYGKLHVVGDATISTSNFIGSTGTIKAASLADSTLNSAGLLLTAYDASNIPTNGSIHITPVANYRSDFISTYMADGAGGNYIINQFIPSSAATAERMRIDSSGNVGIGLANPSSLLQLNRAGSTETSVKFTNGGGASSGFVVGASSAGAGLVYHIDSQPVIFATANTERMRIDSSGNLLVGTTTPTAPLTVQGTTSGGTAWFKHNGANSFGTVLTLETTAGTDDPVLSFKNHNGGSPSYYGIAGADDGSLSFRAGAFSGGFGTERMRITSTGQLRTTVTGTTVMDDYGCRAWVNFDGTGTVAIRASGNVSSITDNGTGTYTVNFTTAMPDVNYGFNGNVGYINATGGANNRTCQTSSGSMATGSIKVTTGVASSSILEDQPIVLVSIFR